VSERGEGFDAAVTIYEAAQKRLLDLTEEYSIKMDGLLARAEVLSVPADRVREIVAAEHGRAQVEVKPFSWKTVQERVDREATK
jgi:hypothetical protein